MYFQGFKVMGMERGEEWLEGDKGSAATLAQHCCPDNKHNSSGWQGKITK